MVRKVLYPAVFVLVVLMAHSAFALGGGWTFNAISTLDWTGMGWGPPYDYVDGKMYMPDGTTLVGDGSLVQIIIGLDGHEIVDPKDYFDDPLNGGNGNGSIDFGVELDNVAAWVQAGADPAVISGGNNVLAYGTLGFTGEFGTVGGAVNVTFAPGSEPVVANGLPHDKLAWRTWSLSKEDLAKWCNLIDYPEMFGVELWYTDGREIFSHGNEGSGPDTGWWIGMPDLPSTGPIGDWAGFDSPIGAEVYAYYVLGELTARSKNQLDTYLGTCVPEPSTMLLIGGALLLLLVRRKK
jgi:hypothetical protein